ncbi:MAG: efflux RND transporter periplasmic adaptor subunit [Candidatus Ryanbacteria bacterium]|nr:efflux RND transporter periplasmic adaptor subunit [Candidatus Ryanbacteria bacterium]
MAQKILVLARTHRFASVAFGILVLAGGYYGYAALFGSDEALRYAFAEARNGTLIVSLSGSGQVSASHQVDVKPRVSGDIVYVGVKNGQEVRRGALLAQLDARDAEKTVRDAKANLESVRLSLEKLQKPADVLSILQAENALVSAREAKTKAEDNLARAYEDSFNMVANAFLDLPDVMTGLNDILFSTTLSIGGQSNIDYYADVVKSYDESSLTLRNIAYADYQKARKDYDQNLLDYKSATRFSDKAAIEKLITQTYDTTKNVAEAVKSARTEIQFYKDKLTDRNLKPAAAANTHIASLDIYTGKTNSHLISLLAIDRTIKDSKEGITSADRTIAEKTESLAKLRAGTDALDIKSQELSVSQRQNALRDAEEKLSDYFVRAPFDGILTNIDVERGDAVTSATVLATLVTRQKLAEISLNEVDAANVRVGQKVTLTFDALPDLTITGSVAEVDAVGTVLQGVVTYNVKVSFDTDDERVKPGMSVSASIILEVKQDVLLVPNSAIKSENSAHFVELPSDIDMSAAAAANVSGVELTLPLRRETVEVGSSNDEFTEVSGGIKDGDRVVVRTIQQNSTQTQTQTQGGLRIPGLPGGGGGGGGFRTR